MIDPTNPNDRLQLSRAMQQTRTQLVRFERSRRETIQSYMNVPFNQNYDGTDTRTVVHNGKQRPDYTQMTKGNLLQLSAVSLQIALAYGEPRWTFTARDPNHKAMAQSLEAAVNRMSALLNVGETARAVAADSFFGFGIFKVGVGRMPLAARKATGMTVGPCVWRVSQDNFLYDITSPIWGDVKYAADHYFSPVDEAREQFPTFADRIQDMTQSDRLDAPRVFPRPSRLFTPERMTRLIDIYFPAAELVGTWPLQDDSYGSIVQPPLSLRNYDGHWSGIYEILTHLYSPDELVPTSHAESIKALHFLFNDVLNILSNQALHAKYNPVYQNGFDKDMQRLWDTPDRMPVGVADPSNFGEFMIPGPSGDQSSFMAALLQLYKQMDFNLDDRLGLGGSGGTATQAKLTRGATSLLVAEAKRKFHRVLELVGRKLGHLLITNNDLWLPNYAPMGPGSSITKDVTWMPPSQDPRVASVDDFDIAVDPFSLEYRSPEDRLAIITQAMQQVMLVMQAEQAGMPVSSQKFLEMIAKKTGEDELIDMFMPANPMRRAQEMEGALRVPDQNKGHYVRENVSERTSDGALMENLTQGGRANGAVQDGQGGRGGVRMN